MATEKEIVLREREAFDRRMYVGHMNGYPGTITRAAVVRMQYPLPKIARPRVVMDPVDPSNGRPITLPGSVVAAALISLWADLFANPTEEVEDES